MNEVVLTKIENGIMVVTINRPEAKNAVSKAVAEAIAKAMDELDANDAIRAAIITGAEGTFCSGMDLKGFVKGELPMVPGRGFAGVTEAPPKKPLIAAVEGYALAGGFELAIACDLIIAADNAKFGIPEVKRGLAAAGGGLLRLPRQVNPRFAMELALTGDFISAERALQVGLINQSVPAGTALKSAKELAAKISANGPLAVAISKQIILESNEWTEAQMWNKQNDATQKVFTSEDAIEGATAFAEKRAPQWKGK